MLLSKSGTQVVAHVVTLTQEGEVVDSSKERNMPYDIRQSISSLVII